MSKFAEYISEFLALPFTQCTYVHTPANNKHEFGVQNDFPKREYAPRNDIPCEPCN